VIKLVWKKPKSAKDSAVVVGEMPRTLGKKKPEDAAVEPLAKEVKNGVVVAAVRSRVSKLVQQYKKPALIAIAVLVVTIGSWLTYHHYTKKLNAPELAKSVSNLEKQGKYAQAQSTINSRSSDPNSQASLALSVQAAAVAHDYKKAVSIDKTIEQKYGLTSSLAVNIGGYAEAGGDHQTALTYYNKAIAILQSEPNNPTAKTQITTLKGFIDQINQRLNPHPPLPS
jgi:hypothetical protein